VAEYCDERVCLSVEHIFGTIGPVSNLRQFFLHVTYDRGSVLLCRRTLCTSGFVDDVIFAHNGRHVGMLICRYRCSELSYCVVVRRLTPLLHRIGCVVS